MVTTAVNFDGPPAGIVRLAWYESGGIGLGIVSAVVAAAVAGAVTGHALYLGFGACLGFTALALVLVATVLHTRR